MGLTFPTICQSKNTFIKKVLAISDPIIQIVDLQIVSWD
jgi:hypothetical protein